jgi:hypothetical protein
MEAVLLQFKHPGAKPTIDDVIRLFDLQVSEVDVEFGIIATDPEAGLYTVLVASAAQNRVIAALARRQPDAAEGIFSNTRVEPFGPPE